ncbi:MAG: hypothetical protein KDC34_09940 [Saprospiraceae bacterium]|nr:hypothetical protein [Saprospiraceae bacterium]
MKGLFISTVLLLCCLGTRLHAQYNTTELGMFYGFSTYLGDLQQERFEVAECHAAYGAFLRYNLNRAISWKWHLYKGTISGSDENYDGLLVRERNLHFRSDLYEVGTQFEITFLHFGEKDRRVAAPYVFVGVSAFYFNPEARWEGKWVALQPLGTEGQWLDAYPEKEPYDLVQWSIPMGIGFNINIGKRINLGFEIGFRQTFTDYLDDVSGTYPDQQLLVLRDPMAATLSFRTPEYLQQELPNPVGKIRGNPENNDLYVFGGFTLSTVVGHRFQKGNRR